MPAIGVFLKRASHDDRFGFKYCWSKAGRTTEGLDENDDDDDDEEGTTAVDTVG